MKKLRYVMVLSIIIGLISCSDPPFEYSWNSIEVYFLNYTEGQVTAKINYEDGDVSTRSIEPIDPSKTFEEFKDMEEPPPTESFHELLFLGDLSFSEDWYDLNKATRLDRQLLGTPRATQLEVVSSDGTTYYSSELYLDRANETLFMNPFGRTPMRGSLYEVLPFEKEATDPMYIFWVDPQNTKGKGYKLLENTIKCYIGIFPPEESP